jgi:hypothetical protein
VSVRNNRYQKETIFRIGEMVSIGSTDTYNLLRTDTKTVFIVVDNKRGSDDGYGEEEHYRYRLHHEQGQSSQSVVVLVLCTTAS